MPPKCSLRLFSQSISTKAPKAPKAAAATAATYIRLRPKQVMEQQGLGDIMIPGQFHHFFKQEKTRSWDTRLPKHETTMYTQSARSSVNEFDSAPTIAQERMADRIQRAFMSMQSAEPLPAALLSDQLRVPLVKVSRQQRRCHIYYDPVSSTKTERGNVHRAVQKHASLLITLTSSYAHLRRPMSIKFVPDKHTKELEDIYAQLEAELGPMQ
ncbi:hypothetical protein BDF14DRAFT_1787850 [Spinellus fusiger]|nr:hypothetical protein BDF14DRAFT_1787850 [Spinellus fusiger]